MALFHLSVTQTKRSAGQSAIASAAYRAGERLYSEYYGEYSDYTRKGGVICSDILLPSHAPPEYADRQTLWNAVEKAERGKNAQLAYSFDIALQNEFSLEENIALAVLITYSPQNGFILLLMAFLISPMGLPLAAIWLLGKVQDLKYAIQDWMYG